MSILSTILDWLTPTKKPPPPTLLPQVAPGEKWQIAIDRGPWPVRKLRTVTVLEIKGAWVRYSVNPTAPDLAMHIETFTRIYTRVHPPA